MTKGWLARTELLYGRDRMERIKQANVLVAGVGGVGAYAAEMLCRTGVGSLYLVDADIVSLTNINRQLPALHSTIGQPKVQLLQNRFIDINPDIKIKTLQVFLDSTNIGSLLQSEPFTFVVDAIDTLQSKCQLIKSCLELSIPIVSSGGAGAKNDIRSIRIGNLWKTTQCPLAKAVRTTLRREGIKSGNVPFVYSEEPVCKSAVKSAEEDESGKRWLTGTTAYLTATFGNYLAWYVLESI